MTLQSLDAAKEIARAVKKAEAAKKQRKDDLIVILLLLVIIGVSIGFAFFAKKYLRGSDENETDTTVVEAAEA